MQYALHNPVAQTMPILTTHDLSRHFGGLKAVEGVSLSVEQGHLHSIIGPNGAGKTTLFNLISGVLKPTRGQILLRGRDITREPLHRTAHLGMGRSFQITNIFPTQTVRENVRLAAQAVGKDNFKWWQTAAAFRHYDDRATHALEQTGLLAVAETPALALAHGDKRRLELAMLIAQSLDIWLLDEPTAGLAAELVPDFMELVRRVQQEGNKTVLLVEHNMHIVMSLSDKISVMHYGELLAEGTPAEIAENPEVQKAYLGSLGW
jgi:branched-chain amino acid transport system ATP-binding protein